MTRTYRGTPDAALVDALIDADVLAGLARTLVESAHRC